MRRLAALAMVALIGGCRAGEPESPATGRPVSASPAAGKSVAAEGPFLRVLGTVQDGGLPHAACDCERCAAARSDPARRRHVAALAIALPASGRIFLVDATPDLPEQLDLLADLRDAPPDRVDRSPIDGVLLTHAHVGHYLGLAWFGYEAVSTRELPVWGSPRMLAFLSANGPWSLLVERRNIVLRELLPETPVELGEGVAVTAVPVPHRDEYTDTYGLRIEGGRRSVLYVPDTDSWAAWEPPAVEALAAVDLALVDGTFFSLDELPGRSVEEIGHPLIADSLEELAPLVESGTTDVRFTHLNHSNPVLEPDSTARERVIRLGFAVLEEGEEIPL